MPVMSGLAAVFYASAAAVILFPASRRWLLSATVESVTPTTRQTFAPLDALRGLAALYLAAFHFNQWPADAAGNGFFSGSWLGPFLLTGMNAAPVAVPLFVVLSGFLIWRSVTRIAGLEDLRGYAVNRVLRIAPLYLAATLVTMLVALPAMHWQAVVSEGIGAHIFGHHLTTVPQFWSLFLEMTFYMIAPFLAAIVTRNRAVVFAVIALLFAISEAPHATRDFLTWKYFFIGIACSELAREPIRSEAMSLALFAAGAALVYLNFPPHFAWFDAVQATVNIGFSRTVPEYTMSLGVGFALMMWGAINSRAAGAALSLGPLRFLGAISYSIFAWHAALIAVSFPVIMKGNGGIELLRPVAPSSAPTMAILLIVIPAMIAAGVLSFMLIERPFLRMRYGRRRPALGDAIGDLALQRAGAAGLRDGKGG